MLTRIWDLVNPGSRMEKSNRGFWIRDKHPGSATLHTYMPVHILYICRVQHKLRSTVHTVQNSYVHVEL
jgi:hypothetical protein